MAVKNATIGMPYSSSEVVIKKLKHAAAVDPFINMDFRHHQSLAHETPVNNYLYIALLIFTVIYFVKDE